MAGEWISRPRSMGSLLPPNYISDEGKFDLDLPRIRPAWLMNESIKSLDSKFPMVPAPSGAIVLYTTPLGEKLRQQPKNKEFDLRDPLRPNLSYNYLHDEHLKVYFRSPDIRKRLTDYGFITDDGYVKCSLKEFNEYRQWIRKLKLDELYRERTEDTKQIEEAKKERLEKMALERDPELLEIMRKRRERRREDAKIREERIRKEQDRQRKLDELDCKRREQFMNLRRKTRDRIQIKRDLERERLRRTNSDIEKMESQVKLRIAENMDEESNQRKKNLEEKKKEFATEKSKKLEEEWCRRSSWSIGFHDQKKRLQEEHDTEFQHHVEERNMRIVRQRRWSQVCYNEISESNRRAFEMGREKGEEFLAKLNEKKTRDLRKWKKKFESMQASSLCSLNSPPSRSCPIGKLKQRKRRLSSWDIESCLLKDLGIDDSEIGASGYSKLGIISRTQPTLKELDFLREKTGLGSLRAEVVQDEVEQVIGKDNQGAVENEGHRFSIPVIVESFASFVENSSDSESDTSSRSVTPRHDYRRTKFVLRSSSSDILLQNDYIPEQELRRLVATYVQEILKHSSQVLGIHIKFPQRNAKVKRPAIVDVKKTKKYREMRHLVANYVEDILQQSSKVLGIEIKLPDRNAKVKRAKYVKVKKTSEGREQVKRRKEKTVIQVREYLSSVLDKAEEEIGVVFQRPPEYEKIKAEQKQKSDKEKQSIVETPAAQLVDSEQKYQNQRTMARKLVCDIVNSAALLQGVRIKFPPQYQSFDKQSSCQNAVDKADDRSALQARQHTAVLKAISEGTLTLNQAPELKNTPTKKPSVTSLTNLGASDCRAEHLRKANLIMIATRVVIQALSNAVLVLNSQRRSSDFFMAEMPKLILDSPRSSPKVEQTARLKSESQQLKASRESRAKEYVPREIDFLSKYKKSSRSEKQNMASRGKKSQGQGNKSNEIQKAKSVPFNKPRGVNALRKTPGERVVPEKESGKKIADKEKQKPGERVVTKDGTGKTTVDDVEKPSNVVKEPGGAKKLEKGPGTEIQENVGTESGTKISDKVEKQSGKKFQEKTGKENNRQGKVGKEPGEEKSNRSNENPQQKMATGENKKIAEDVNEKNGNKCVDNVAKEPGDENNTTSGPMTKQHSDVVASVSSGSQGEPPQQKPGNQLGDDVAARTTNALQMKSPSLSQITPESSVFGLENGVRSGATPPTRETTSSPETRIAGSPSSAIFRMLTMREQREVCDLSPQSSYVILPKLSSSESTFISRKMERLLKDYDHVSNSSGLVPSSQERFPILSAVPASDADMNNATATERPTEAVKLPRVPSVEVCPQRSPTPVKCPSQSSLVSLPHIEGSRTSLTGVNETVATNENTEAEKTQPTEEQAVDPPISSRRVSLKNKKTNKKATAAPFLDPQKPENEEGKPASRTKSELPAKHNESAVSKRKGSMYHSTIAIVSPRRPSLATQERKISHNELTSTSSRTNTRRSSLSKSTGEVVVPGRKTSYGDVNRGSKEPQQRRMSKATVRKPSVGEAVKNIDTARNVGTSVQVSSHSDAQTRGEPGAHVETAVQRSQETSNADVPKASDTVTSRSFVETETYPTTTELDPKTSEDVLKLRDLQPNTAQNASVQDANEGRKLEHPRKRKKSTKAKHATKSFSSLKTKTDSKTIEPAEKEDIAEDIKTNKSKSNSTTSTLNQGLNKANTKTGTEKETKTLKSNSSSKVLKLNQSQTGAGKKANLHEDFQISKSKRNSKTASFSSFSKQSLVGKNLKKDAQGDSDNVKTTPKRSSGSRVELQESKPTARVTSVTFTKKISEKDLKRRKTLSLTDTALGMTTKSKSNRVIANRSSTNAQKVLETVPVKKTQEKPVGDKPSSKDSRGATRTQDSPLSDLPEQRESDTEVVVHIYVPDSQSLELEAPQENTDCDKVQASVQPSSKTADNSAIPGTEKTGDDNNEKNNDKDANSNKDEDNKNTPLPSSSKHAQNKDGDIMKSSSRKAFGDNPREKNLMNIIPRNSLDILKVTKISPKLSNDADPSLPANDNECSSQAQSKMPRSPAASKSQNSRNQRRTSMDGRPTKVSSFELSADGFGLSLKSSSLNPSQPSMHRLPSKQCTRMEKVDEGSCLKTSVSDDHSKTSSRPVSGKDKLTKALSITRATVVSKPPSSVSTAHKEDSENLKEHVESHTEESSVESPSKKYSKKVVSTASISSASFSDVVQGTQLLNKEPVKDEPAQNASPQSSALSLGSNPSQAFVPSPPVTSKPDVVSPKVSRVKRNLSNASSVRSRLSHGSSEMSPTASLEIVKLSSQTSHGWVSSPTSSVKFLPPIDARASKASNHSDESLKRRPRTTESTRSKSGSAGSRSSTQSKKGAVIEIRRSNSSGLRVDGKNSGMIGVKSSTSGNSVKQAVVGF